MKSRRSIRLKGDDYSQPGAYFVTVCARDKHSVFGSIRDEGMLTNEFGKVVEECWNDLLNHYPMVLLDAFVVMPDHMHGIIVILDGVPVGKRQASPLPRKPVRLGNIIGSFKSAVTKRINEIRDAPAAPVWQRNYFEHIIRSEKSLNRIREYIITNPQRWSFDHKNTHRSGQDDFDLWLENNSL